MIEKELTRLIDDAKKTPLLRAELLAAAQSAEPVLNFCKLCRERGYEIYPGELIDYGQDMNDSKLRATNGGGSFEIEGWNDAFEGIICELKNA